jgi:hypothetical protein
MKKQTLSEEFKRTQQLTGILKEEINEPITWDWTKARSTSEDDNSVVYKVWGTGELYNYYGEFELSYADDGSYNDIEDKDTRENLGQFIYIAKFTKDTDEKVGEVDPLAGFNENKNNKMKKQFITEAARMQKLAGILKENQVNEELRNIESELEDAGFSFDDGILGGVGSGGGGYYDSISDKINGYDIDEFNEDEFNNWYDNFSLSSFNSSNYDNEMMDDYGIDRNKISQIPSGFYNVGEPGMGGFAQIKDNGDVILYANPTLSDMDGEEYYPIFSVDATGNIVKDISKKEVVAKLKQNIENPAAWGII